jgi:flavin-dependent dehydrogenase
LSTRVDVAVLGGGPGGLAVATLLARRGREVVVLEREARIAEKAGETFGPRVKTLLERLGASGEIEAVPFRGVRSAWGSSELGDRPSLLHPLGAGWHVDRARFEEGLQAVAERAGARIVRAAGACGAVREGDEFRVDTRGGVGGLRARYVVDASGRGAPGTARLAQDRCWLSIDRQVALVARATLRASEQVEPELLVESSEHGWWYAAPQPGGTLVLAWLTDADLLGPREQRSSRFAEALERTVHIRALAQRAEAPLPPVAVRADTGFLMPDRGRGWCAVGDAAMGGDPLAGDGVERALSGALRAAPEIERELEGAPFEEGAAPSRRIEGYLGARARYYSAERRWPKSPYWRRRLPVDFEQAEILLSPLDRLRRADRKPDAASEALVEALLPRRAVEVALDTLSTPQPAHAVLSALRRVAPLDDRRLLIGLQLLVEQGLACAE